MFTLAASFPLASGCQLFVFLTELVFTYFTIADIEKENFFNLV